MIYWEKLKNNQLANQRDNLNLNLQLKEVPHA